MFDTLRKKYNDIIYTAFRVVFGLLFLTHGLQKFGIGSSMTFGTLPIMLKIAGVIETVAGLLVILGLFTSIAAFIGAGEMAVAYWFMHAFGAFGKGAPWYNPLANSGELAVLYCLALLYIAFEGGGKYSLEKKMK